MADDIEASPRRRPGMGPRIWQSAVAVAWLGFWFWAFSFAYSDSFFRYDSCSRSSVFAAALFGAAAVPASACRAWRRHRSILRALAAHAAGLVVALLPLALVSHALSRVSGPCHLEADDSMGAGIDFLILVGIAIVSLLVLLVAWIVRVVAREGHRH